MAAHPQVSPPPVTGVRDRQVPCGLFFLLPKDPGLYEHPSLLHTASQPAIPPFFCPLPFSNAWRVLTMDKVFLDLRQAVFPETQARIWLFGQLPEQPLYEGLGVCRSPLGLLEGNHFPPMPCCCGVPLKCLAKVPCVNSYFHV